MANFKQIILLLVIVAIEFNLCWNGFGHQPNWVKVYDTQGEIEITETREKIGNTYYWSIYDLKGDLITFLNFWSF